MTGGFNFMTSGFTPRRSGARQTVIAVTARALVEYAEGRGADRNTLLATSGLGDDDLADQHARVDFDKYVALMRNAKELCDDPAFALHFGEAVDLTEVSIAGAMAGSLTTIDEARTHVNRYSPLIADVETVGGGDRWSMRRSGGQLWAIDSRRNPNETPEITESAYARVICSARRSPMGDAMFKEIRVTHSPPSYRAEYDRIFRIPVTFDSDENAVRLDEVVMASLVPPPSSKYVNGLLKHQAEKLLTDLDGARSTRQRVEKALLPMMQRGVNIDAVCSQLGVSRQTLFRRLREEGTTFEQIADEVRRGLALHYLSANNASVGRTAHLLGYSDTSAFSRAFKRWTGRPPRDFLNRGKS